MPYRTEILLREQVRSFASRLPPEHRRAVKSALRELAKGKGDTSPLEEELAGLHRLRVGRYRIVFRYESPKRLLCIFMEQRKLVYDLIRARPEVLADSPPE